ncbi:MAG: hypothetical protein JWL86_2559 [Rhizobium sp.]|jgi:hypothetical protein|nr:hypothetical protein [Rhizobium sp.]
MQVVVPFKNVERPTCRCGAYMTISLVEPLLNDDKNETRVFYCDSCGHKLHVLHAMARAE